jgi:hypothetical protein
MVEKRGKSFRKLTRLIPQISNRVVQLNRIAKVEVDPPFKVLSYYSGDELLIDWSLVETMFAFHMERLHPEKHLNDGKDDIKNLYLKEIELAQEFFAKMKGDVNFQMEFDRYLQSQQDFAIRTIKTPWIEHYVTFRNIYLITNFKAIYEKMWKIEDHCEIWKVLQWVFDLQLYHVLQQVNDLKGKPYFWIDIGKVDIEIHKMIDRSMEYGFKGGRLNIDRKIQFTSADLNDINNSLGSQNNNAIIYFSVDIHLTSRILGVKNWEEVQTEVVHDVEDAISLYNVQKTNHDIDFYLVREYKSLGFDEKVSSATLIELDDDDMYEKSLDWATAMAAEKGASQVLIPENDPDKDQFINNRIIRGYIIKLE